jgi:hypothetical protein
MGRLRNQQHELVARALAEGKSRAKSHRRLGASEWESSRARLAVSRCVMDDGSSGDAVNRPVAQIELSAKPIGDFLGASLIPDQIARRGNNHRLKTEGMILAHNNFQIRDGDLPGDHLGELLCSDVFSNHGEIPRFNRPSRSDREFLKDSSTNMVDHEAVQICFGIAGHAANARRAAADSNCSTASHRREIGFATCINLVFSG